MTIDQAKSFVQKHGVVLVSGKGPVPRLTEAVAGERLQAAGGVIRRLTESSRSFRQWPNHAMFSYAGCRSKGNLGSSPTLARLVRVAARFPKNSIAQVREEHTASGRHVNREVPFPKWVPVEVRERARL